MTTKWYLDYVLNDSRKWNLLGTAPIDFVRETSSMGCFSKENPTNFTTDWATSWWLSTMAAARLEFKIRLTQSRVGRHKEYANDSFCASGFHVECMDLRVRPSRRKTSFRKGSTCWCLLAETIRLLLFLSFFYPGSTKTQSNPKKVCLETICTLEDFDPPLNTSHASKPSFFGAVIPAVLNF